MMGLVRGKQEGHSKGTQCKQGKRRTYDDISRGQGQRFEEATMLALAYTLLFIYLFVCLFIYLFIYGCVGSLFLCEGFL